MYQYLFIYIYIFICYNLNHISPSQVKNKLIQISKNSRNILLLNLQELSYRIGGCLKGNTEINKRRCVFEEVKYNCNYKIQYHSLHSVVSERCKIVWYSSTIMSSL